MLSSTYSSLVALLAIAGPALAIPVASPDSPADGRPTTKLLGDGDPHQNYYYKQVTENLSCGDDSSCTDGQSKSFSISVSASLGAGGGSLNWINGGFGVSESWSTTETESCTGSKGDTVCLWYAVAHTAYTAQYCELAVGCSNEVIRSPNNDNLGGGYICGKNAQCKNKGSDFWKDGPAGGPQANKGTIDQSNLGST